MCKQGCVPRELNAGVEAAWPNAGVDAAPNAPEPKAGVAGVPLPNVPNAGAGAGVPNGELACGCPKPPSAGVPKPPAAGAWPVLPFTPACARTWSL